MKVAVIGGGASGLMAAYWAAKSGNDVTVFEKNEKCGKKIYITGKGRCNLTNSVPPEEFLQNVVNNSKFLTGAIYSFDSERTKQFFVDGGMKIKTERGNRVFPLSDKASDVTKCLVNYCNNVDVKFIFNAEVQKICINDSTVSDIIVNNNTFSFDKVIIATGGKSYPSTGSNGDGYKFAEEVGHSVIPIKPALCGINLKGDFFKKLQGLSLKNVTLSVYSGDKVIKSLFGELLITHYGISGPIVLTLSSFINRLDFGTLKLSIDLKPALSDRQLDARLVREFSENGNKSLSNVLKSLLPVSLIDEVISRLKISGCRQANTVTRAERESLLTTLKKFDMIAMSLRDFDEAIITSGGVNVKEINPKTMESKIVSGLYFCGEVLDVDALTGGFNLQVAFATGYAAGNSIKEV